MIYQIVCCIDEFKVVYCDAMDAYSSVMVDKKLEPVIRAAIKASFDFSYHEYDHLDDYD